MKKLIISKNKRRFVIRADGRINAVSVRKVKKTFEIFQLFFPAQFFYKRKNGSKIRAAPPGNGDGRGVSLPILRAGDDGMLLDHGVTLENMDVHPGKEVFMIRQNGAGFFQKALDNG